jgi:hypothetical protein
MIYRQPPSDAPVDQGDLIDGCLLLGVENFDPQSPADTVRLDLLTALCASGRRVARVQPLYREHLSKHFADSYSRIGLPEPYETD